MRTVLAVDVVVGDGGGVAVAALTVRSVVLWATAVASGSGVSGTAVGVGWTVSVGALVDVLAGEGGIVLVGVTTGVWLAVAV
jgi:hypothetical protein